MNAARFTKKPTLMTALLSAATLAGYATYRLASDDPEPAFDSGSGLADSLPAIVLNDLDGTPTPLDSFADDALLINFWATWCAPCLREIPMLKAFHEQQAAINVIGIAADRVEPVLEYAAEMQFNYPVLVGQSDAYQAMAELRNDAQVMPFSVFTAPGGAVIGRHYGELHAEHLDDLAETIGQLERGAIDIEQARGRIVASQARIAEADRHADGDH